MTAGAVVVLVLLCFAGYYWLGPLGLLLGLLIGLLLVGGARL